MRYEGNSLEGIVIRLKIRLGGLIKVPSCQNLVSPQNGLYDKLD